MDKYQVRVHPRDEKGNRAHVYWPPAPDMHHTLVTLGEMGVGFSEFMYAINAAQRWAAEQDEWTKRVSSTSQTN